MMDQAAIAALVLTHPVAAVAAGVVVLGGAIAVAAQPQPRKTRRFRIERIPVAKPKPMEPAARVYGSRRRLAERQQAWIEAEAAAQQAPSASVSKAAGEAFADWFDERVIIPTTLTLSDVIAHADWETDYTEYCDSHGLPRLFGDDLFAHMDAYTRHYNCTLGSTGEVNGAHLKDKA
jgi:hypothetical protein